VAKVLGGGLIEAQTESPEEFGARARKWIKAHNLSQAQVARMLGMHPSHLSKILKAQINVGRRAAAKLEVLMSGEFQADLETQLQNNLAQLLPDKKARRIIMDLVRNMRPPAVGKGVDFKGHQAL